MEKYKYDMFTIYRDMPALLNDKYKVGPAGISVIPNGYNPAELDKSEFIGLSVKEKYEKLNESLKTFLLSKIFFTSGKYEEFKDKSIRELLEEIEATSKDKNDAWIIDLYILKMVATIKDEVPFDIWENNTKEYKGKIIIDYNKKSIDTYVGVSATKMYDFIVENIFNLEYLESPKLKRTPLVKSE